MPLTLDTDMLNNLAACGDGVTALMARQLAQEGITLSLSDEDLVTLAETNTDGLGELLRDITFDGEGMGCYSTFDVADGWTIVAKPLPKEILFEMMGDGALEADEAARAYAYHHTASDITVAWYWDGDGTLLFHAPGRFTLVNHDCKCAYDWKSVDLAEELKKRWNYAEIAAA